MMRKWILKAIVQKFISFLPFKHFFNSLFQRYVTGGIKLTEEYFFDRIVHAREHLHVFRLKTGLPFPFRTLELGTGWYPIVPIFNYLSGSDDINSIDINRYSNKFRILEAIRMFDSYIKKGTLNPKNEMFIDERVESLGRILSRSYSSAEELLKALNIKHIIADASKTSFPSGYFDLIHSNNTLEHIYEEKLEKILTEFTRILGPKAVMSHFIDMSDHFAHFDRSITIYNFLRFSDFQWKLIDNSIQPQNRLRMKDYQSFFDRMNTKCEVFSYRDGDKESLRKQPINSKYSNCTPEALAISHCHLIVSNP